MLAAGGAGHGADDGAVPVVLVAHPCGTRVRLGALRTGRPRRLHGLDASGSGRAVLLAQPVYH